MPLLAISLQRHFVFELYVREGVCVCVCIYVRDYVFKVCEHINRLWEFPQIYNFGAVADKVELVLKAKDGLTRLPE